MKKQLSNRVRDRYDIYTDILEECYKNDVSGIKSISLMYRTLISYQQLTEISTFFIEKGLIYKKDGNFFITEKGINAINILRELNKMIVIDDN